MTLPLWMPMETKNLCLLATFLVELCSGLFLLHCAFVRPLSSTTSPSSSRTSKATRFSSFFQPPIVWVGSINSIAALACYFLVHKSQLGAWVAYLQWGGATPPMIVVLCLVFGLNRASTVALFLLDLFVICLNFWATSFTRPEVELVTFILSSLPFLSLLGVVFMKKYATNNSTGLMGSEFSVLLLSLILLSWLFHPISWLMTSYGYTTYGISLSLAQSVFAGLAKLFFGILLLCYRNHLTKAIYKDKAQEDDTCLAPSPSTLTLSLWV